MSSQVVYSVENVIRWYKGQTRPANDHINLQIFEGEIFGILGDNGAGKSTLVKQMAGLIESSSGQIRLFGKPLSKNNLHVPHTIGYMPQEGAALNSLTTQEALYFTAHLRGLPRKKALAERERLIDLWDIEKIRHQPASKLSGGEKRLLLLATAMAGRPRVLLLDEPTNDLAPQRRRQVWRILRDLNKMERTTIIFITHDAIEAERIIQRVGIMRDGRLLAVGSPSDLKKEVDDLVRLEIVFDPQDPPQLPAELKIIKLESDRWIIYIHQEEVVAILTYLNTIALEDFKVYSATLEDLYMHFAFSQSTVQEGSHDVQSADLLGAAL
ncbi:MAG: ABC transporter ATP-binding protein [Chloroflexota bacterium]